jgi:hypothetical protein
MAAGQPKIALPPDMENHLHNATLQQAAMNAARVEVAKEIMGSLCGVEYMAAIQRASSHANKLGLDKDQLEEIGEEGKVEFGVDLGQCADLAAQGSLLLLQALGMIRVEKKE